MIQSTLDIYHPVLLNANYNRLPIVRPWERPLFVQARPEFLSTCEISRYTDRIYAIEALICWIQWKTQVYLTTAWGSKSHIMILLGLITKEFPWY